MQGQPLCSLLPDMHKDRSISSNLRWASLASQPKAAEFLPSISFVFGGYAYVPYNHYVAHRAFEGIPGHECVWLSHKTLPLRIIRRQLRSNQPF